MIDWLNPGYIVETGGLILVLIIIFAESGLFFGFFLPGDSLVFTTGLLCGTAFLDVNIVLLNCVLFVAAVLGYMVGYYTGKRLSTSKIFREEKYLFRRRYLDQSAAFLEKHGLIAFIIARFIPLIRTYIPILAGTIRMDYAKFSAYNFIGGLIWVPVLTLAGYFLGRYYPDVLDSLTWIVIGFVVITLIPILHIFRKKRSVKAA